jgi:hypothetical protein
MSLNSDNTTRFFTVVGAAYVPERHFDSGDDRNEYHGARGPRFGGTHLQTGDTGSWLQDDR